MEFFDKTQYIWKQTARFCSSAAFIVFFLFLIFKQIPAAISALVLAVAFLLASFRSRDFTRQGQAQYDLWLAFRRFLKDFSSLDRSKLPQLILWEHYLVYAVVLGVAEEVLRQLPAVYPELNKPENEFGRCWDSPDHSDSSSNGAVGAGGITSASFAGLTWFPAAMGSIETAFGSGDFMGNASGGGFSSGGGGGGGGGGGDAD
jgi:uncharacterized membrane protein